MMLAQVSFIPLYFDEEEADLWQALQRIEPEKRSSFIKETLRQVLLRGNPDKNLDVNQEYMKENREDPEDRENEDQLENLSVDPEVATGVDSEVDSEINPKELEPFSLEALFSESPVSDPKELNNLSSKGYEYMMKHIIGTEEDEEVLKFLQGEFPIVSDE
jgi:hypothetical protein